MIDTAQPLYPVPPSPEPARMIRVSLHLTEQSQPIERDDVVNAYSKGGFYCLFRSGGVVEKYPIEHVWRVTEEYAAAAPAGSPA